MAITSKEIIILLVSCLSLTMAHMPNQWLSNHPKTTSHRRPMVETLFLLRRDSLWVLLTRRMLLHSKIIPKCRRWMVIQIILAQVSMSLPKIRFSAKIKRKPSALTLMGKVKPIRMIGLRTRGALAKHPTRITARLRIRAQRLLFQASSVLLRIARLFQNYQTSLSLWTNLVKNTAKMKSTIPQMTSRSRIRSSMRPIETVR